jgi:hypothetical protein
MRVPPVWVGENPYRKYSPIEGKTKADQRGLCGRGPLREALSSLLISRKKPLKRLLQT